MQKFPFYYLKSCDTCLRILKQLPKENLELINIKESPLTESQLTQLKDLAGSYKSLFNFRAQKLKELSDDLKPVTEDDFLQLLLLDYTYLARPVAIVENIIFVGNRPEIVDALKSKLEKLLK